MRTDLRPVYTLWVFHPCPSGLCVPMDVRYLADEHAVKDDGTLVIRRKGRFVAAFTKGEWENLRVTAR